MKLKELHESQIDQKFVDYWFNTYVNVDKYRIRQTFERECTASLTGTGAVDVEGDMVINTQLDPVCKNIPFKLNMVNGSFKIFWPVWNGSTENFPSVVTKNYKVCLKTDGELPYIPRAAAVISLSSCNITSLLDTDEIFSNTLCSKIEIALDEITEGGLSLILLKNPKCTLINRNSSTATGSLPPPFKIINKYIGRPDDIFSCQTELINSGYEAFAQL